MIKISEIKINSNRRSIDKKKVSELSESIKQLGLLNPITITRDNVLVAGQHRIEAVKLLEWQEIECNVVEYENGLFNELAEIDENLIRNELHFTERGDLLVRKKVIYEELYPETKREATLKQNRYADSAKRSKPSFVEDTAIKTGESKRTIETEMQISNNIIPEIKQQIKENDINKTEALEIARAVKMIEKEVKQSATLKTQEEIQAEIEQKAKEKAEEMLKEMQEEKERKRQEKQKQIENAKQKILEQTKKEIKNQPIIYNLDVEKYLKTIESVDLLITDPPYSTDVENLDEFILKWYYEALNKVKDTGRAYIFIGAYPKEIKSYLNAKIPNHLILEQILVWTYKNTLGNNPKDRYKLNYQSCLYFKGIKAPDLNIDLTSEQWAVQEINAPDGRQGDRYHKWQKPIEISDRFIRHSTKENDTVLDLFSCTGTFLLSASKLGRKAIGCDISLENLKIAEERGCTIIL